MVGGVIPQNGWDRTVIGNTPRGKFTHNVRHRFVAVGKTAWTVIDFVDWTTSSM